MTKPAFAYFDDSADVVDGFRKTVRHVWHLPHEVFSNSLYGQVNDATYDEFEYEICKIIEANLARLECIFLDLDFSGNTTEIQSESSGSTERDFVGFLLGRAIRKRWPQMPIIIVSRFTEREIIRKGLIFDFDDVREGIALTQMELAAFNGMIDLARKKRQNLIESFGDVSISFRTGRNRYFRRAATSNAKGRFGFVAMPFDTHIVSNDVWEFGIKRTLEEAGVQAIRADLDLTSQSIMDEIATNIFEADFVIADLTGWNANVLYELGLAHGSNKDCILICNSNDMTLPFDVRHLRVISYESNSLSGLRTALLAAVHRIAKAREEPRAG